MCLKKSSCRMEAGRRRKRDEIRERRRKQREEERERRMAREEGRDDDEGRMVFRRGLEGRGEAEGEGGNAVLWDGRISCSGGSNARGSRVIVRE